jgi:hypothetical protein
MSDKSAPSMDELAAAPIRRRRPTRLCEGKSRQTAQPCRNAPTPGSRRCRFHGGRLNQGNRKQRDIAAQAKVEQRIRGMLPPETEWRHLDPLEAADAYRAEADAWLAVCRSMVDKLEDFEVTSVLSLGDGRTIEKVGAELRAIVVAYEHALDRAFAMAATSVRLGIQERYVDQLDRHAELFARVLGETMRLLALDMPPETYAAVIPQAIAAVQAEHEVR